MKRLLHSFKKVLFLVNILCFTMMYSQISKFEISFEQNKFQKSELTHCDNFFSIDKEERCLSYKGNKKFTYLGLHISELSFVEKKKKVMYVELKFGEDKTTVLDKLKNEFGKYSGKSYFGAIPIDVEKDESYNSFYWETDSLRIILYQNTLGTNASVNVEFSPSRM